MAITCGEPGTSSVVSDWMVWSSLNGGTRNPPRGAAYTRNPAIGRSFTGPPTGRRFLDLTSGAGRVELVDVDWNVAHTMQACREPDMVGVAVGEQ
jgi:hypothetical protein